VGYNLLGEETALFQQRHNFRGKFFDSVGVLKSHQRQIQIKNIVAIASESITPNNDLTAKRKPNNHKDVI
jgi:hypothetical protein